MERDEGEGKGRGGEERKGEEKVAKAIGGSPRFSDSPGCTGLE